ncbi:MAG TPA: C-terminal binding protein [Pirellulales bacterium]|jgi:D-3-phosphoglycerate dehydrogenase|nr:C-terminal binding protein [Pirellulales bacterium]
MSKHSASTSDKVPAVEPKAAAMATPLPEPLKVALVDLDGQPVPDWVRASFVGENLELTIEPCATRDELARHAAQANVVWLFGGSRILQGNLDVVPRCWAIVRTGSGTDNVPVEEASRRGIMVANTPAAFSDAVSDHVVALLFSVLRRVALLDRLVRSGHWNQYDAKPLGTVVGRTLGLVGFGHIARLVARKLSGFEMQLLVFDPFVDARVIADHGGQPVTLDRLLAESDFVSLHCPLTPQTKHLISSPQLRSMKPAAVLINTSRGPVVDEQALIQALREGWIAGAALDVVEHEPPGADNALLHLDNVVLTPHSAGLSASGTELRWRQSIEAVIALSRGRWPASCVNRDRNVGKNLIE